LTDEMGTLNEALPPNIAPWLGDFNFTGWNTSHRPQILLPNYVCTARSYLTIR